MCLCFCVCLCVSVCFVVCLCVSVCCCIWLYVYLCFRVCQYVYLCLCLFMGVCLCVGLFVPLYCGVCLFGLVSRCPCVCGVCCSRLWCMPVSVGFVPLCVGVFQDVSVYLGVMRIYVFLCVSLGVSLYWRCCVFFSMIDSVLVWLFVFWCVCVSLRVLCTVGVSW